MIARDKNTKKPYTRPQVTSVGLREVVEALGPALATVYREPLAGIGD